MRFSPILRQLQYALARFPAAVDAALKVRNQCDAIIGCYLGPSVIPKYSGEEWLARLVAPHCATFMDVGANVGDWAATFVPLMRPGGLGVCYEPSETASTQLVSRLQGLRIEVVTAALSSTSGIETFYDLGHASELSSLLPIQAVHGVIPGRVRVTTIDEEFTRLGWSTVDMLKVDTEGNDFNVMRGAAQALAAGAVGVLQFEYGEGWAIAGSTLAGAIRYLRELDYTTYLLLPQGLVAFDYPKFGEYFRYSNYVAVGRRFREILGARLPAQGDRTLSVGRRERETKSLAPGDSRQG